MSALTFFVNRFSPSILTEVLFVSVGAIALGVGLAAAWRYLKRR